MKKYLEGLCFELTRQCNMKCLFCGRGEAPNIDITKEIINKALDETADFNVYYIRLNGGEPMLNKEGLIYLVDEIIRRDYKLCQLSVFTNGTVRDHDIKEALIRMGKHCKKCAESSWGKDVKAIDKRVFKSNYYTEAYVNIIVSTNFHDNNNLIDETINFYNEGTDHTLMCAYNQDKALKSKPKSDADVGVELTGNAEKNVKKLIDLGCDYFIVNDNHYCLIDDSVLYDEGFVLITKLLTICANGNVIPGCMMSYEKADTREHYITNIKSCNDNLYRYIELYSWRTPISNKLIERKRIDETYKYLFEHNIVADPFKIINGMSEQVGEEVTPKELYNNVCQDLKLIDIYSNMVKDKYHRLKHLTFNESQIVCAFFLALNMEEENNRARVLDFSPWNKIDGRYLTDSEMQRYIESVEYEYTLRTAESAQ